MVTVVHTMSNGIRKCADQAIYSSESGMEVVYPGTCIEVGFSDPLVKSRRDITLWLENSGGHVSPRNAES